MPDKKRSIKEPFRLKNRSLQC